MIIIRDLTDVHTLKLKILQGDILEIYNIRYRVGKYYFRYKGILCVGWYGGEKMEYCYDSELFRDIQVALYEPDRYFVKLVQDTKVEPVILEEDALI